MRLSHRLQRFPALFDQARPPSRQQHCSQQHLDFTDLDASHFKTMAAHQHNYALAKLLLYESNYGAAIAMAKDNLASNPPLDCRIKNLVLIACAEDDWMRAESYRCEAEMMWMEILYLNGTENVAVSLDLSELRGLLDYVARKQADDAYEEPVQSTDGAFEASNINDISELQQTTDPAMLTESGIPSPEEPQPAPAADSNRRRPGRRANFTFRCPQQLGMWWSVEEEQFEAGSINSRYRWSRVGKIMEVTGVARDGGACTECAKHGRVDGLVDPNDAGGRCAHCIYRSKDCR